jgi:hypothetical protein
VEAQQASPQAAIIHIIADYWRSRAVYLAEVVLGQHATCGSRNGAGGI